MIDEIILPCAIETEKAVLGILIDNHDLVDKATSQLDQDCFHDANNKIVWNAISHLKNTEIHVDLVTVTTELQRLGLLARIGGAEYIVELQNAYGASAMLPQYMDMLVEGKKRRLVVTGGYELAQEGGSMPIEDINKRLEALLDASISSVKPLFKLPKDFSMIYMDGLEKARKSTTPDMVTGFEKLDRATWGLHYGELTTVAARTGRGKSVWCNNVAVKLVSMGKKVLYFSTEMSAHDTWNRYLSITTGIDAHRFRRGWFEDRHYQEITAKVEELHTQNLFIVCDYSSPTVSTVRDMVKKLKPDVTILDFLQRFKMPKADRNDLSIGDFMKGVKNTAMDLQTSMIVVSQLNRDVDRRERKQPVLADLRDSGSIEQDSDVVLFLWEDKEYDPDMDRPINLTIAKNRHGVTGQTTITFTPHNLQMREIADDPETN